MFASLGWDPTWQRRMPARIKMIWTITVVLATASLYALRFLAVCFMPSGQRWIPISIVVFAYALFSLAQVLVRREVFRRLDSDEDQLAARQIQVWLLPTDLPAASNPPMIRRSSQ